VFRFSFVFFFAPSLMFPPFLFPPSLP
jgi:hypothetical protein